MKKIELNAVSRQVVGKKSKKLRAKGLLPAVVYGHGFTSQPISIDGKEFARAYKEAGTSTLIDLKIDEEQSVKVLLHEPQHHYLHGTPVHADFYAVKMTEKIDTAIPIHFVGESPAVEELEGNFISNRDELEIRCLPGDLIANVEVDISVLQTFDDQIKVKDITLPETVEVLSDPEEVVALVAAPISEEELEAELAEDKAAEEAAVGALGEEPAATEEGEAAPEGEAEVTPEAKAE